MECEENLSTNNLEKCKRDRSYCVVSKCGSQGTRNPELSFFRFPKAQYDEKGCVTFKGIQNLLRKKDWISMLGLERNISDRAVVCSKHFKDSDFTTTDGSKKRRLKLNAVPSLLLPHENIKQNGYVSEITKEWEEEETASLISLYKMKKCLYDQTDVDYSDTGKRSQAYREIQNVMSKMHPGCTIREIMYKISHFRSQYMVERRERDKCIQSGSCTEDSFKPKMWNFDLLKFLDDYIKQNEKKEVKEEGNSHCRDKQYMEGDESYPETVNQLLEEEQNKESTAESRKEYLSSESIDENKKQLTTTPITIKFSRQVIDSLQETALNKDKNDCNDKSSKKTAIDGNMNDCNDTNSKNKETCIPVNEMADELDYICEDGSEHVILSGESHDIDEKLKDEPEHIILSGESHDIDEELKMSEDICIHWAKEKKKSGKICGGHEDIFGRYVASKMKILKSNALLQLQTEQAILEVLTNAGTKLLEQKISVFIKD